MTEIKICGITRLDDALLAAACGVDALGFIFYRKSPRYIMPAAAQKIIAALPESIAKVGVFVNGNMAEIEEMISSCRLDIVQLQGNESPEDCRRFLPSGVIKAVHLKRSDDLKYLRHYDVRAFLADSREGGFFGGTGKRTDWELAAETARLYPLVLAGGLNEENILDAIRQVSPSAVDINSGVEESPGKKNHERMERIISLVRAHETSDHDRKGIFKVNS
jgi:phosphoribosylanthranilate isomerase